MQTSKKIFKKIYEKAKAEPDIIGFFLGGSRGKNLAREYSDYDVYIIVNDNVLEKYRGMYPKNKYKGLDLMVFSLTEFENLYCWGGPEIYGRYTFAHIKVLIDKNNKIQKILNEKSKIPGTHLSKFISSNLDEYINFLYRSLKCLRDGDKVAARLEAAGSIVPLLKVMFAIHNGRLSPYYKYLKWELENFPLDKIPFTPKEIIDILMKILDDADYNIQIKLLNTIELILREEGYGYVFDSWGDEFIWMKKFELM